MSTRFGINPRPEFLPFPLVVFLAAVTQMKIQLTPVFLVFPHMLIDALVTDTSDAIPARRPLI
jgi:hypothetical protein